MKITMNVKNETREITVDLHDPPGYGIMFRDPWRPFLGSFCCSPHKCITNEDVDEIIVLQEELDCYVVTIMSFLPSGKKLSLLTADFGMKHFGSNCSLSLV